MSRWDILNREGRSTALPTLQAGGYLLEAFTAMGMVCQGPSVLTWAEIDAFARLTGAIAEPWEAGLLRQMSVEYLAGFREGDDPLSIPPAERTD